MGTRVFFPPLFFSFCSFSSFILLIFHSVSLNPDFPYCWYLQPCPFLNPLFVLAQISADLLLLSSRLASIPTSHRLSLFGPLVLLLVNLPHSQTLHFALVDCLQRKMVPFWSSLAFCGSVVFLLVIVRGCLTFSWFCYFLCLVSEAFSLDLIFWVFVVVALSWRLPSCAWLTPCSSFASVGWLLSYFFLLAWYLQWSFAPILRTALSFFYLHFCLLAFAGVLHWSSQWIYVPLFFLQ